MDPVEIALVAACAALLVVAGVLVTMVLALRRSVVEAGALTQTVDRLREQVEELARRESARETASEGDRADWVITSFDEQHGVGDATSPRQVSAQEVVGTALGEPMIKMAALSYGVRQALREERRAHLAFQVRREYRRRRRGSRARARTAS